METNGDLRESGRVHADAPSISGERLPLRPDLFCNNRRPVAFVLNRLINVEDFSEPTVRNAIREVFAHEVQRYPDFPTGREHRKHWEVAMAVLALREGGALGADAEVLAIGAGSEATLYWLTNNVRRVWATDLQTDGVSAPSAAPTTVIDPSREWPGPWNPRRLVARPMDACELIYEDDTFDAIVFSGSIEHFGSLDRIGKAMDEACRVLKPGGTLSLATDFLLDAHPLVYADQASMVTPKLIDRVLVGERDWAPVMEMDFTISDATRQTQIDQEALQLERENVGAPLDGASPLNDPDEVPIYPHLVLSMGSKVFTSMHLALRKSDRPSQGAVASPGGVELSIAGPREDVADLARHLQDPVVVLDAGCRWGFGPQWEALGEYVRLIGFDADGEECRRLEERYAGRLDTTFVPVALGSERGRSAFRHFAEPAVGSLYAHDPRWLLSMAMPREGDTLQEVADVDLETVDDWCAEHAVEHVDALKLDVQGHELEILRGASSCLTNVRTIEAEVWLNPVVTGVPLHGEIDAFLREHGFCLWRLDDQAHYPVIDGEGAPGSVQHMEPYGHAQIQVQLPSGFLCWANAHYVRKEIFEVGVRLPWPVRLRDAVLMNALSFHDLTLLSLRRLLEEDPPETVAADVRAVLGATPGDGRTATADPPGEQHGVAADASTTLPAPVPAPSRRPSPLRLLRALVRLPYHPLLWRLDRNANHGQRQTDVLQAHLVHVERLLDDVRIRQEQEDDASRVVVRELKGAREAQDAVQRTILKTREANDSSHEAVVEWTALISRALGEDRDDRKAGDTD